MQKRVLLRQLWRYGAAGRSGRCPSGAPLQPVGYGALRAIRAVFRASTRLDGKQPATSELHWRMKLTMDLLRLIRKRSRSG